VHEYVFAASVRRDESLTFHRTERRHRGEFLDRMFYSISSSGDCLAMLLAGK
jgi:hypothetical protein